uniref:Secreted protein n=1 Tax=Aegilops tauschii subsp. strangulata TaxID=200361 RepID=A0A453D9S4_AEGTS
MYAYFLHRIILLFSVVIFFCEETTDYIETRITEKNTRKLEITHMSFLQNNVADAKKNVPVAGRRCISARTLDREMSPGGGVVAGPRTPGSLHSAPLVTPS